MTHFVRANEHQIDVLKLRESLILWGKENFRAFPWRLTNDPYKILMSEIMLHRTQAIQVVSVYTHFVEIYPDLHTLAQTTKEQLHSLLYSLGLRWRIDLIINMTEVLIKRFDGIIPVEQNDLMSLPGISTYIATAVRCFAWDLPDALADTNTIRIVGRLFGLPVKDSSRRNRLFLELLSDLVDRNEPRHYNYAMLDLADRVCTKKLSPDCPNCPLLPMCKYGNSRNIV